MMSHDVIRINEALLMHSPGARLAACMRKQVHLVHPAAGHGKVRQTIIHHFLGLQYRT